MHAIDDHIFVGIFTGKFSHDIVAFFFYIVYSNFCPERQRVLKYEI